MASWFRSWHGAPTDSKFSVIAKRASVEQGVVSAVWWALLDHASQADDRGNVQTFDAESYAAWSGWDEDKIVAVIQALNDKGLICNDHIANWEKRQPVDDTNADRQAKWRKKNRDNDDDVTQDNDTKDTAALRNALRNYTDTDQIQNRSDTEQSRTEAEAETEQNAPPVQAQSSDINCNQTQSDANSYFGMPRPVRPAKVTADGYTQEAQKLQVPQATYQAICNRLLDLAGWTALVNAGDDTKLNYVKADAITLIKLGNDSLEHIDALAEAWQAANSWRDSKAVTPKQLLEYASQKQAGIQAQRNGSTPASSRPMSKVEKSMANAAILREMLERGGTL